MAFTTVQNYSNLFEKPSASKIAPTMKEIYAKIFL